MRRARGRHAEARRQPTTLFNEVPFLERFARAAEAGVQVIMETHSDHILNGMRLAVHQGEASADKVQLLYFTRKAEGDVSCADVVKVGVDDNGRLDQWPDGFFDEWDKALSALLWPRSAAE